LLTKIDLAEDKDVAAVERRLSDINPGASIVAAANGDVTPARLFSAALFDPASKIPDVQAWLRPDRYGQDAHRGTASDRHHDHKVRSFCLTFADPLPWQTVSDWLTMLRQWRGEDLLRVKGILNVCDEDFPVAIHGIHHIFHPPVQLSAWPDGDRHSRIVFITRGLERAEVEQAWSMIGDRPTAG
jgi:G3E family GTPase